MANSIHKQHLLMMLKQHRRRMSKAQRKHKPRSVKWIYPWAVERQYYAQLSAWLKPLKEAVNNYIKYHGETMLKGDSIHTDTIPGSGYKLLIETMRGWVSTYFDIPGEKKGTAAVMLGLGRFADLTKWNGDKEWGRQMMAISGQEFTTTQKWWDTMRLNWIENNNKLIKTVANRYIDDVDRLAEAAIVNGYAISELQSDIDNLGLGLTDYQCSRLARDQIGKLNGQITQNQCEEAGVDMYIWSTAGDDRVRVEPVNHEEMDGILCRWDDATVYSEDDGKTWISKPDDWEQQHPGYAIQCRCTALPYVTELLNMVDKELDAEVA